MRKTITSLLLLSTLALCARAEAAERPMNVLFLVVDDLNTWLLEDANRYAGKVIAPNFRRLADSGVVFHRAYTASPVCSPSRTALLSGVRPWQSGVYENGVEIGQSAALRNATPLPKLFRDSGYYVASYGKIAHGWDFRKSCDEHVPHKRDPVPPGAPFLPFTRGEQDWGPTHLAEEKMNDSKYASATVEQLRKQHDRPFFIACGLFHPHMPWYVPQKYFDMFPLDEVTTPQLLKNDLADVPPLGRGITKGKSQFVENVLERGFHKQAVQAYLATTAYADAQFGRVLDALDSSPYRDNTIVLLMSDHGFHLGEKHHWQKSTLWEEATHCLLMLRVPGMTPDRDRCQRFVSLQDVYPTLADLCGMTLPANVEGRSLVPLLQNPHAEWKSTAITAYGDRYVTFRDERFRYIRYRNDQEELYDVARDPHEWTNEIRNSEYAVVIAELRKAVPALSEMALAVRRKRRKQ